MPSLNELTVIPSSLNDPSTWEADFDTYAKEAAAETRIPFGLIKAVGSHETGDTFDPAATNPKSTAFGPMQILEGTAEELGIDRTDLRQNIFGGARYLKQQIDRFGSTELGLVAYFKGPQKAEEYGLKVPGTEGGATAPDYVDSVLRRKKKYDALMPPLNELTVTEIEGKPIGAVPEPATPPLQKPTAPSDTGQLTVIKGTERPLTEGEAREIDKTPGQLMASEVESKIGKIAVSGIQGLAYGLDMAGMSLGNIIEYGGNKLDVDLFKDLGQKIYKHYSERPAMKEGVPEEIKGKVYENPELMLDPQWWTFNVGQIAPSLAMTLGPAAFAKGSITAAGMVLNWTPKTIGRLSALGAMTAGGGVGGAMEGSSTYRQMKEEGYSEEEAQAAGELMALGSAGLNAISVGRFLTKLPKNVLGNVLHRFVSGGVEAITEWLEEPTEVVAKRVATGEIADVPQTIKEAIQAIKDGANVAGPSFVLGALTGGMVAGQTDVDIQKKVDNLVEEYGVGETAKIPTPTEIDAILKEGAKGKAGFLEGGQERRGVREKIREQAEGMYVQEREHESVRKDFEEKYGTNIPTKNNFRTFWEERTGEKINREEAAQKIKESWGATPEVLVAEQKRDMKEAGRTEEILETAEMTSSEAEFAGIQQEVNQEAEEEQRKLTAAQETIEKYAKPTEEKSVEEALTRDMNAESVIQKSNIPKQDKAMLMDVLGDTRDGVMKDKSGKGLQGRRAYDKAGIEIYDMIKRGMVKIASVFNIDVRNIGGINDEIGHDAANNVLRDIMNIVRKHMEPFAQKEAYKVGGDEVAGIVIASEKEVWKAITDAKSEIAEYVRNKVVDGKKLSEILHPKHDKMQTGAGQITFGVMPFEKIGVDADPELAFRELAKQVDIVANTAKREEIDELGERLKYIKDEKSKAWRRPHGQIEGQEARPGGAEPKGTVGKDAERREGPKAEGKAEKATEVKEETSADKLVRIAQEKRKAAEERIKKRLGKGKFRSVTPQEAAGELADHVIIGASYIAEGAVKFADWSAKMVKQFGEEIKPHLKKIYDEARKELDNWKKGLEAPPKKGEAQVTDVHLHNVEKETGAVAKKVDKKLPPTTKERQRGFIETTKESPNTPEDMKEAIDAITPQKYPVLANEKAINDAVAFVKNKGEKAARDKVFSKEAISAEKTALAVVLARQAVEQRNYDEALEIINEYDKQLRKAGQGIQAARLWNSISPVAMVRLIDRMAEKKKVSISDELKKKIVKAATVIQSMKEGAKKDAAMLDLMNMVAEAMPLKWWELFGMYRYQNMLSNPRSHERNVWSALFNAFLVRPVEMGMIGVYDIMKHPNNPAARDIALSEIPQYYKDLFNAIPNATRAAVESYKRGFSAIKLDLGRGDSTIEFLRRGPSKDRLSDLLKDPQKNKAELIKRGVSVVPRLMEAEDIFTSTLIAMGEKARLMRKGTEEGVAYNEGKRIAEEYLFRERLNVKNKQAFVAALDALGKTAVELRTKLPPLLGILYSWMVPFITTPINIAKMNVRFSPLGIVGEGGKLFKGVTREQVAKSFMGSAIGVVSAMMALAGKTAWAPPPDDKRKKLFYASGKKPFSVEIGGRWYPMWYFGPFGLMMAYPTALKYYFDEDPKALTEGTMQKLYKSHMGLLKFLMSQTSISGMNNFLRVIEGETDTSVGKALAFTTGQIIPFQGFVRYISTITDPYFRRPKGFKEALMKDFPGLSKNLEPYEGPLGLPAKRDPLNYFVPYDIGREDEDYEILLQEATDKKQIKELLRAIEEGRINERKGLLDL